jgi:hypothetical protein
MYANVRLQGKVIPDARVVPTEAVIRSGTRDIVFVARGDGRFEPREVRIGEEGGPDNCCVRIISGLLEGEEVVTSAQFMLDSESRLQEAIQKMLDERSRRNTIGQEEASALPTAGGTSDPERASTSEIPTRTSADMDHTGHEMAPDEQKRPADSGEAAGMLHDHLDSTSGRATQDVHNELLTPTMPDTSHESHEPGMQPPGAVSGQTDRRGHDLNAPKRGSVTAPTPNSRAAESSTQTDTHKHDH